MVKLYPLAIVGAGMAGLTASLYASRYGIKHILIGKVPGGKGLDAISIENYPGFKKISGAKLMQKVKDQVFEYKPDFVQGQVKKIREKDKSFVLTLDNDRLIEASFLLLALGSKRRRLGVPGEEKFIGKGLHFCATCDGYFYKDKTVLVVGGGNAGVTAALMLSDLAQKVYLLEAGLRLKATPIWQERLRQRKNVKIVLNNTVQAFIGENKLERVRLSSPLQGQKEIDVDGVFVEIGSDPNNALAKKLGLKLDSRGYIEVNQEQRTSHPRIYAAGDITTGSNYFQQLLTSAAEGAVAVYSLYRKHFGSL